MKSQPRVWTPEREVGQDSGSGKSWSELMESLRELPWSRGSRKPSVPLHPWALRTYFGPSCQLCERCLEEEGGHDEVDVRNVNMVGQQVVQDPESGKQAGALVGCGRMALQVIYRWEGHTISLRTTAVASGHGGDWHTRKSPATHSPQKCREKCTLSHRGPGNTPQGAFPDSCHAHPSGCPSLLRSAPPRTPQVGRP